ncbi:AlbA family DNA-binding domain-containing protein [Pseudomonas sp. EA_15y_Pfl1_P104]|uniref:AlbA family DNA-binding domain-containing protein n=1 Tax=Pseudomonas sp. EA_15y_Pfl1_P104 TaxID=3088686 RepID=UPI0030D76406
MNYYNPFNTSIDDLTTNDLVALRTVTEGWYIEYKQELSKSEAIAKSISALANSYGGWVFYGIAEESKDNSVAGEFHGIDRCDVDAGLQRIRQAVANSLSPACHYEAKALYGPNKNINLGADKAIICVAVPQSIEAPHIHKKGSIYRRVADGSEPVAENDRYMIEKMFDRSKAVAEEYKEWIADDPEFSEGETGNPHVRIMISSNPWKMPRPQTYLNIEKARTALGADGNVHRYLPFDSFYSTSRGVVARQCAGYDPTSSRPTWNIYYSLSGDISIPLKLIKRHGMQFQYIFSAYKFGEKIATEFEKYKLIEANFVDLNQLFHIVTGIVQSQRALQKQAGWPCEFHVKIKIYNAWHTIPFLDTKFYVEQIQKNGIPVCLTDECLNPPGTRPDTFLRVKDHPNIDDEQVVAALQAFSCFTPIAEAFGIPLKEIIVSQDDNDSTEDSVYQSLINAGVHASSLINWQD